MDKFDLLVESLGVDEAALKLFPNIPNEHQREVLLRHNLQLWTLLSWHATGDEHAPRNPVIELLRDRGEQGWMLLHRSFGEIAHDRQRDWLLACAEVVPDLGWFTVGARVACPLAAQIIEALRRGDIDALPRPEFDRKFWKLLVASSHDGELADVLKAWLASLEGYARLQYIGLLHSAGVLDRIVGLVALLPNVGAPSWPLVQPDGDEYPLVNVAHWIALNVPEAHREDADGWLVEQFVSSARSGVPWLDLFWRIAPRLRPRVALASLDLEPRLWAPFAGTALAERIAAGRTDLWPRAMAWLRSVRGVRDERTGSYDSGWVERQYEIDAWLRMLRPQAASARTQCKIGPLFAATATDGAEGKHAFHPAVVGTHVLEHVPLGADSAVDAEWIDLYAADQVGGRLQRRFLADLNPHRARVLLEHALSRDIWSLRDDLARIVELTGPVPLHRAPAGAELLQLDPGSLGLWRLAAGESFDVRLDEWLDHAMSDAPGRDVIRAARTLGRPLTDDWKRRLAAALPTWRFADILAAYSEEPWLVSDENLPALCRSRLAVEGDAILGGGYHFDYQALPDCLRAIVAERVPVMADDRLAAHLLSWLAKTDSKAATAGAVQRVQLHPGVHVGEWWATRLSSVEQWEKHGKDVLTSLLSTGNFHLVWQIIEGSARAFEARAKAAAAPSASGRPRHVPDRAKFTVAIHLAMARALCASMLKAIEARDVSAIARFAKALPLLEPPPRATGDLVEVIDVLTASGLAASAVKTLTDLRNIAREGAPEADLGDLLMCVQVLQAGRGAQ